MNALHLFILVWAFWRGGRQMLVLYFSTVVCHPSSGTLPISRYQIKPFVFRSVTVGRNM